MEEVQKFKKKMRKKLKRDILFVCANVLCIVLVILLSVPMIITKSNDVATRGSTLSVFEDCPPNIFWIVLVAVACLSLNYLWLKEKNKNAG